MDAIVNAANSSLPCRWVIHTVGPNAHRGQTDPALLRACIRNSPDEAARVGARTVVRPAVSAGVYGRDPAEVAREAVAAVRDRPVAEVELVRFVLFSGPVRAALDDPGR